jgi:multicomponent Na+:H+ antiporter subunit A
MSLEGLVSFVRHAINRLSHIVLGIQNGSLHRYLSIMLTAFIAMPLFAIPHMAGVPAFQPWVQPPVVTEPSGMAWARALSLLLIAAGTMVTFASRTHLRVVIALGVVGYIMGGFFGLAAAPDVSLVQVHIETLITVLFVLLLLRIPHRIRSRHEESPPRLPWNFAHLAITGILGAGSALLAWLAVSHQPGHPVASWYNEHALLLVDARDVVAAVLIHFRALDTLGELIVFAIGTAGVLVLVQFMKKEAS